MGSNLAYDLASDELGLDLEMAIGYHLRGNHYPPVPYWDEDLNREIPMPEGVTYRGQDTAPAWAIIEQHHLDAWCEETHIDED
jgi:hypothetical protein